MQLLPTGFSWLNFFNQVGTKGRGESVGELALMTISPRTATVMVSSNSATIFSLARQEFQNFVILSGIHADLSAKKTYVHNQSVPEAPELPLHYVVVPKAPPFHPNCAILLPQSELARAPGSSPSGVGETHQSRTALVTSAASSTLVTFRGLLLQPWPDALNDSTVDVLGAPPLCF